MPMVNIPPLSPAQKHCFKMQLVVGGVASSPCMTMQSTDFVNKKVVLTLYLTHNHLFADVMHLELEVHRLKCG